MADNVASLRDRLVETIDGKEQRRLVEALVSEGAIEDLRAAYLANPFVRLTDEEAQVLAAESDPTRLGVLIAARHAAQEPRGTRHVVFCMPKSGSSFTQSALTHALQLPNVSLTSFGSGRMSSRFGMNGREQELDELSIVKWALRSPRGFIAQHHTRYTQYLGLQLNAFHLRPVVTTRNVYDSIVSFDDMMMGGRGVTPSKGAWTVDPHPLPLDYPQLDPADRYVLLARSLGIWQVQFLISWKRALRQNLVKPLLVQYERDILDPERFVERVAIGLGFDDAQRARLRDYALRPDRDRSRLNVGQAGRGRALIPEETRKILVDYARYFREDLTDEEIAFFLE